MNWFHFQHLTSIGTQPRFSTSSYNHKWWVIPFNRYFSLSINNARHEIRNSKQFCVLGFNIHQHFNWLGVNKGFLIYRKLVIFYLIWRIIYMLLPYSNSVYLLVMKYICQNKLLGLHITLLIYQLWSFLCFMLWKLFRFITSSELHKNLQLLFWHVLLLI